jgi:hypothetical protein
MSFIILQSCSTNEPNFSVSCGSDSEYSLNNVYLDFDFKKNIVVERTVPTELGLRMNAFMVESGSDFFIMSENVIEYKIIDLTPTLIRFGNPAFSGIERVNVFDRASLEFTITISTYNTDGSLSEPYVEGMSNPSVDSKSCKKPVV